MHAFKDAEGREWTIRIDVAAIKRVRDSELKLNLLAVLEDRLLLKLAEDPILLCDLLYVLCRSQADERNMSDEDFGTILGGDTIDVATTALMEELVDFFPQVRRQMLRRVLKKTQELEKMMGTMATDYIESEDLQKKMATKLRRAIDSAGNSLESSEPTPAP